MRVVVLADTHMAAGGARRLPEGALDELARADVILHAGDVGSPAALAELERMAPVHAVLGNNDHELVGRLPEVLELSLAGVAVAMIHDSGPSRGREGRLHRRFPVADVVVFGHSHLPLATPGIGGQLLFNPGSPTWKRTAPNATVGVLVLDRGVIRGHRLVEV